MRVLACLCLLWAAMPAFAGPNLIPGDTWDNHAQGNITLKVSPAQGTPPGVASVITISTARATEPYYMAQISRTIPGDLKAGSRLRFTFWARSAGRSPMRATVERTTPPYTGVVELNIEPGAEWKRYTGMGATEGYGLDGLSAHFQTGRGPGEIEIAGVTVENLGPDPALVAAEAACKPDAVRRRIRQVRTGVLDVVVRDRRGRPVPNASVSVRETRSDFLFGCNIFGLSPADTGAAQSEYQRRFTELFNYATLPFYWGAFEPEQGRPQHERLTAMARWCAEHGLAAKGHPLIWHEVYPRWAPKDPDAAAELLHNRVKDILPRYAGTVKYWDVLNEANVAPTYAQTGEGAWIKRDGAAAVVAKALGWAREAGKGLGNTYLYNDFETGDANDALLAELARMKALPDAVGIQSHMHSGPWPMERVWAVTERFARFGKPIHYTEATVVSAAPRSFDFAKPPTDWVTTPEGEAAQADYVKRFYSLLFSHPSVQAITYWDFSDAWAWLNAPAGFLRKDMSPKPAYDALKRLIRGEWWTDAKASTSASGRCSVQAFYGSYAISVTAPGGRSARAEARFPQGKGKMTVEVRLP